MEHIAEYLYSVGEKEMADEVLNADNRLTAFADGLDKDCFDAVVKSCESLQSQLATMTKQRDELLSAQQWQPIETAPKDASEILVYTEAYGIDVAQYWKGVWKTTAGFIDLEYPTHWMPLPAAPAIASVKGEV